MAQRNPTQSVSTGKHSSVVLIDTYKEATRRTRSEGELLLLWEDCEEASNIVSLSRYAQQRSAEFIKRYLAWNKELAEKQFDQRSLTACLQFEKIPYSLWWLSPLADKSSYQHSYVFDTFKLWAIEEILLEVTPKRVISELTDSRLNTAVLEFARTLDCQTHTSISFKRLNKTLFSRLKSLTYPLRGTAFFLMKLYQTILSGRKRPQQTSSTDSESVIFSYVPNFDETLASKGVFSSAYWQGLESVLQEYNPRLWVMSYVRSTRTDYKETLRRIRELDSRSSSEQRFLMLEDFASIKSLGRSLGFFFRLSLRRRRLLSFDSCFRVTPNSISFWCTHETFAQDFFYGKSGAEACWYTATFEALTKTIVQPRLGLFCWENCPWELALSGHWREQHSAPLIGYQHSSVSANDLRIRFAPNFFAEHPDYPQPKHLLCNSPYVKSILCENSRANDEVHVVEAHRYAHLATQRLRLQRKLPVQDRKLFFALDAVEEVAQFQLALLNKVIASEALQLYQTIKIKAHPLTSSHTLQSNVRQSAKISFVDDVAEDLIEWSDVTVAPNSSTIALEIAWQGKYAILCADPRRINLSPLVGIADVAFVSDAAEFTRELLQPKRIDVPDDLFRFTDDLDRWRNTLTRISSTKHISSEMNTRLSSRVLQGQR